MENNLMDEFFNRISLLKQEQENLNAQINEINKEITNQQYLAYEKFWSKKETEKEKIETNEGLEKIKEYSKKLSNIIVNNIKKIKINYKPFDFSSKPVYISGDFNNWSMIEMNRDKDTYYIEVNLEIGFSYLYCFYSNGNKYVDYNQPLSENKDGVNNIIDLPGENGKSVPYKFNENENQKLISIKTDEKDFFSLYFSYNKFLSDLKNFITSKKSSYEKEITKKIYDSNLVSNYISNKLMTNLNENFLNRIIVYNNTNYILKSINIMDKCFKGLRLYDPNGIICNAQFHETIKFYTNIPIDSLFINSYILTKTESETIINDFKKDEKHFLKLYYQIQKDTNNRFEKNVIPYKVIPENLEIAQYDIKISENIIKEIIHRESNVFVKFESILIGEVGNNIGLVTSSTIKVYTTLYNKDILNILHLHLNDTSQEITIDSEFLEKNDNILEHKIATRDAMGKLLTYKLIFKEYKLVKIFYFVNDNYIDEPNFEEIRFTPNGIVKLLNGEYKGYFGKIKQFPLGMLARKNLNSEDNLELKKIKSFGYPKIGICKERSLEELPGFLSIEIMFLPDNNIQELKEHLKS